MDEQLTIGDGKIMKFWHALLSYVRDEAKGDCPVQFKHEGRRILMLAPLLRPTDRFKKKLIPKERYWFKKKLRIRLPLDDDPGRTPLVGVIEAR